MNILVVAAHPDDEVLGCGGTIARHSEQGDNVHIVILAEGITSRDNARDLNNRKDQLTRLSEYARRAGEVLGVRSVALEGFPDNRMDSANLLDVIKVVEGHIARVSPGILYTHHGGDLNIDHRIVHNAAITACRPFPGQTVDTLLFFEIPSSTEWQVPYTEDPFWPNWFVDISGTLDRKLEALSVYSSEMRTWPHPRSGEGIEHLARHRGASIGCTAAEAFCLGRKLNRIEIGDMK